MDEALQPEFINVRLFDWDPSKRERNLKERHIDFQDMQVLLQGPTIVRRSNRKGETRYMVWDFLKLEVVLSLQNCGDVGVNMLTKVLQ